MLLDRELRGSLQFFLDYTNLTPDSPGFGLTADSTKRPSVASIAAVGFALTAWVIACERGFLPAAEARAIVRGTLRTLCNAAAHHRGFFAHFLHMENGERFRKCEYSTIDTALCLNGVITAAAYFDQDAEVADLAQQLLERVDWHFIVFTRGDRTLFRMAYNPDRGGGLSERSCVRSAPASSSWAMTWGFWSGCSSPRRVAWASRRSSCRTASSPCGQCPRRPCRSHGAWPALR
ncbi:MAG: hypothetical protein QHH80_00705 [Anaerolineae bacterium]|nr:hypothetical protein [Anaerolineae bacterium]